jgi:hypothetical protein
MAFTYIFVLYKPVVNARQKDEKVVNTHYHHLIRPKIP